MTAAPEFRWQAVGRRKTSVARVYLTPGTGKWDINGRTLGDYFPRPSLVQHIQQSFTATDTLGAFDVKAHVDGGDFVIVVNAEKVRLTGRKEENKTYFSHTGYMGHERHTTARNMLAKHPDRVIEKAVFGMLPKTSLARQKLRGKLKVYAGPEHPHAAQQPRPYSVTPSKASA